MHSRDVRTAGALLLVLTALSRTAAGETFPEARPAAEDWTRPTIRTLLRDRRDLLREYFQAAEAAFQVRGAVGPADEPLASPPAAARALFDAELAAADNPAARRQAVRDYLDRVNAAVKQARGAGAALEGLQLEAAVLEGEVRLRRLEAAAAPPDDAEWRALLGRWCAAQRRAYAAAVKRPDQRGAGARHVAVESARLLAAELAAAVTGGERDGAHRAHVQRLKDFERASKERFEAGALSRAALVRAQAARAEAEAGLLHAGAPGTAAERVAEWLKLVREEVKAVAAAFDTGAVTFAAFTDVARRLVDAELAAARSLAERVKTFQSYFEATQQFARLSRVRFDAGAVPRAELLAATAARMEAEIWLLRARNNAPDTP